MSVKTDSLEQRRSELAARRASLSAQKQQELSGLLKSVSAQRAPARVIPKRPFEAEIPLSSAQERLWFLNQLEPESTAYNLCNFFHITGRLNLAALKQSIDEVIR